MASLLVLALAVLVVYRSLVPDPQPIDPGDRVRISGAGMTVFQDTVDRGDDATCRLERGGTVVDLAGGSGIVSTSGLELEVVGHTPRRVEAGTYTLVCSGEPGGLYAGRRTNLIEAVLLGGGSVLLFVLALVVWLTILARRRRSRAIA